MRPGSVWDVSFGPSPGCIEPLVSATFCAGSVAVLSGFCRSAWGIPSGFDSPRLHQDVTAQDDNKSCAVSLQPQTESPSCAQGQGTSRDKINTPTERTPSTFLHPDYAVFRTGLPPDLAAVMKAWPNLPEAMQAGIVAMVRAAAGPVSSPHAGATESPEPRE